MKALSWNEHTSCGEIVREAEDDSVVLIRDGHAVALVMPFDDDDLGWFMRERDPEFLASIAQARQQVVDQDTVSHQDLKRELGIT